MAISQTQLNQLYLAYFGRPADFDGLVFYTSNPNFDIWSVAAAFSASPESQALYGSGVAPNFISASTINAIYQNLFNRDAEPAGLAYWAGEVASGRLSAAGAAYGILIGAQNDDAIAVANKLAASAAFTAALDTAPEIIGYAGDDAAQAARDWLATVTSDPATLTAALAGVDAAVAAVVAVGGTIGETFTLTTGQDEVIVTDSTTIDTVKGLINDDGVDDNSTFSVADVIEGNGKTIVQLTVAAIAGSYQTGFVEVSGVNELRIVNGDSAATLTIDATNFGTDISEISLSGVDGIWAGVENLEATGQLDLSVSAGLDGTLDVEGSLGGLTVSASLSNDDDSAGSSVSVGSLGIDVVAGDSSYVNLYLGTDTTDDVAALSASAITIGDVNLTAGQSAEFDVTVSNDVYNTRTALQGAGTATAGAITLGNVTMTIGADSTENSFYVYNYADSNTGAATVGSVVVGDVDVAIGKGGELSTMSISMEADSVKGAATVGDLTVGNVTATAVGNTDYGGYFYFEREADAITSGNAVVGNGTLGNVSWTGGDNSDGNELYFYGYADAVKGNATVGTTTVGDLTWNLGNEGTGTAYGYASISNSVQADTGNVSIGNVVVGDISMNVGTSGAITAYVYNWADSNKGTATIGTVTVGNISGSAGLNASIYGSVEATVDVGTLATDIGTIGNMVVGNIDLYGSAFADIGFGVLASGDVDGAAATTTIGDVTVGNITMTVENSANVSYWQWVDGSSVGNIEVGDISFNVGADSQIDYLYVSVSATDGDVASYTIGDVTVDAGNGVDLMTWGNAFYVFAEDNVGDVAIGNVSITGGDSAVLTNLSLDVSASGGAVGDVTVGDVTLGAGKNGSASFDIYIDSDEEIGAISVGAVSGEAAGASAYSYFILDANAGDDITSVDLNGISMSAAGASASASAYVSISAASAEIGTVSLGDLSLEASGSSAWGYIYADVVGDTVGLMTAGNIDLTVANTKAGAAQASATVSLHTDGALTVGDITVTAGANVTDDFVATALANAEVILDAVGALTVGNITVTGGVANDDPLVLDNLGTLSNWLSLTGSTKTIGSVDYSGYEATATIDVSALKGAGAIMAAQDDTVITDNATKNIITLGAGDDTVNLTNTSTLKADATVIDEIIGFDLGDDIIATTLNDNDFVFSSTGTTYAQFLLDAQAAMTNFGTEIYAQKIGSDTYVAFEKDAANATLDFVVKLTGVTTLDDTAFNITIV